LRSLYLAFHFNVTILLPQYNTIDPSFGQNNSQHNLLQTPSSPKHQIQWIKHGLTASYHRPVSPTCKLYLKHPWNTIYEDRRGFIPIYQRKPAPTLLYSPRTILFPSRKHLAKYIYRSMERKTLDSWRNQLTLSFGGLKMRKTWRNNLKPVLTRSWVYGKGYPKLLI